MPIQVPQAVKDEKNKLEGKPWHHLFEVEYDTGQFLRLVDYSQDVTFDGKTFSAAGLALGERMSGLSGEAEVLAVGLDNVGGTAEFLFDTYEMSGKKGTLWTVSSQTLADPASAIEESFEILDAGFDDESGRGVVRLVMETDLLQIMLPLKTFTRTEFPGIPTGRTAFVA